MLNELIEKIFSNEIMTRPKELNAFSQVLFWTPAKNLLMIVSVQDRLN